LWSRVAGNFTLADHGNDGDDAALDR
jgi:hypothetical protein